MSPSDDSKHKATTPDLDSPALYINRELSQLEFNKRVLEEAHDKQHPLLERVKLLGIFANNLDEFFMIRVSGLRRQLAAGVLEAPPDGMSAAEQLAAIRKELLPNLERQTECWRNELLPKLKQAGIEVLHYHELKKKQGKLLGQYFEQEIFPALTPLAFDPAHPFPHISNLSLNLAVVINDPVHGERFARLKVPNVFPRLIPIPTEESANSYESLGLAKNTSTSFVWIEEVIAANLALLFPGLEITAAYPFRITRDADLEIEGDEAADLLTSIEEGMTQRQFGSAVRLEIGHNVPEHTRKLLIENLQIAPYQIYTVDPPMGMADLLELTKINRPDLKDAPFLPATPPPFTTGESYFSILRRRNVLLYHPYDSFNPVVDFIQEAARDPQVIAIKQTLYRVGQNSPVVNALLEAREEHGKQVAVLVELKARFDEENNIVWARALERAGVHVTYGLVGLKTHAKICLVVRRERDGIVRYVHMSTGNYNAATARMYTDLGYFTCDPDIGADASDIFNALTGYSRKETYRKLMVAPGQMRQLLIERIEREIAHHEKHRNGYIAFKMNSLVDKDCIKALYRASQSGVKIDLQVRGICCLRPGVPGVSETITVTSIVGRFLEHTRIYYFHNNGQEEVWLGSADLMPRNLDRRMETLFPIEDLQIKTALREYILKVHLQDNAQSRQLSADGSYERLRPKAKELELNSQLWMIEHRGMWNLED